MLHKNETTKCIWIHLAAPSKVVFRNYFKVLKILWLNYHSSNSQVTCLSHKQVADRFVFILYGGSYFLLITHTWLTSFNFLLIFTETMMETTAPDWLLQNSHLTDKKADRQTNLHSIILSVRLFLQNKPMFECVGLSALFDC